MRFRPLHEGFGAEVLDFDVQNSGSSAEIEALRAALDEHQLLLFRGGRRISPERQVEITGWFGPLADNGSGLCTVLHNENSDGGAKLPFHADFSYTDAPIKGISLHAIELPPAGTVTAFASGIHGWETLPEVRQTMFVPMTLRHGYRSENHLEWPEFTADHPVRLLHPRTGRPILYVTEYHAQRIYELDPEESDRIIAELFAHLYAPERVSVHQWALYDLLMWDNLAVQHARPERSDLADGARAMQRVSINDVPFPELLARARAQEQRGLHA